MRRVLPVRFPFLSMFPPFPYRTKPQGFRPDYFRNGGRIMKFRQINIFRPQPRLLIGFPSGVLRVFR